ncbi:MAG: hypothetical protein AB8U25_03645 [Rickettsiales endosymbiont of Dermacentor nuttalli]
MTKYGNRGRALRENYGSDINIKQGIQNLNKMPTKDILKNKNSLHLSEAS